MDSCVYGYSRALKVRRILAAIVGPSKLTRIPMGVATWKPSDLQGFLWILTSMAMFAPSKLRGFLWIPTDSCGYGFSRAFEVYGYIRALAVTRVPMASYGYGCVRPSSLGGFLWILML